MPGWSSAPGNRPARPRHGWREDRQRAPQVGLLGGSRRILEKEPRGQENYARLERKHGKGKALTVLAHKLARAVYYIWKKDQVFDQEKFLAA